MKRLNWILPAIVVLLFAAVWALRPSPARKLVKGILENNPGLVRAAIKRGANANQLFITQGIPEGRVGDPNQTVFYETPLTLACKNQFTLAALELLRLGADPNGKNMSGETPMSFALGEYSNSGVSGDLASELVIRGADPNVKKGVLLFAAVHSGDLSLVKVLLQHGANARQQDEKGRGTVAYLRPKWDAQGYHHSSDEIKQLLLKHGAKPEKPASSVEVRSIYRSMPFPARFN